MWGTRHKLTTSKLQFPNKRILYALAIVTALLLMANVELQQAPAASLPPDIGTVITTVGQYGLLAWLIIRAEARQSEQQKAWREERRWLMEEMFKLKMGSASHER